ncbi:helix-turn-helix domain-containing protein, partial [Pseudonocardia pini]|uniref:helix-turn-helix domain-containing protein n=1 Tax=Pseudonocardia pini TaxID=2758030 RepID=UPI0015F08562
HLDREFERVVGLTPKALGRILRLRRLLASLDVHADVAWSGLAAEWGWFDQSHFIRDFKRHTGVTPSAYVRAQRAVFAVGQAADGFVPEL